MRPRLIAVDDAVEQLLHLGVGGASMRPRLIAVDDAVTPVTFCTLQRSFNEATADRRG